MKSNGLAYADVSDLAETNNTQENNNRPSDETQSEPINNSLISRKITEANAKASDNNIITKENNQPMHSN